MSLRLLHPLYRDLLADSLFRPSPLDFDFDLGEYDTLRGALHTALRLPYREAQNRVCRKRKASDVACSDREFSVTADVADFKPAEVSVRQCDNRIVISATHEERADEQGGYVKRKVVRTYALPRGVDASKVEAQLGADGVLRVTAPRVESERLTNVKTIPIQLDGAQQLQQEQTSERNATLQTANSNATEMAQTTIPVSSN